MKGNLMILVCFLAGVFVGLGDFAPEWLLGHDFAYNYSFAVDCTSRN